LVVAPSNAVGPNANPVRATRSNLAFFPHTKRALSINLKSVTALGFAMPSVLLAPAEDVIE